MSGKVLLDNKIFNFQKKKYEEGLELMKKKTRQMYQSVQITEEGVQRSSWFQPPTRIYDREAVERSKHPQEERW